MKVLDEDHKASIEHTIYSIFESQRNHQYHIAQKSAKERIASLQKLMKAVLNHREEIHEAMWADFRKPSIEVDLSEIYMVTSEMKHAIRHLRKWMKPKKVSTPLGHIGTRSQIIYQPKGVCLIISPWNFPFNLTIGPLVSAISAGNTVVIKPSEYTVHSSAVIKNIIEETFDSKEVAFIEGDQEVARQLLDLPFNHVFFTGSPAVGKSVMKAASKHLTSVTLELGGKSPVIVDETANLDEAASKIVWGKYFNAGQACISPDYLFVHENVKEALMTKLKEHLELFYGSGMETKDCAGIVNLKHFQRIQSLMYDAVEKGAVIAVGGEASKETCYISPTVLTSVNDSMEIMKEEIFGPVLPVLTYTNISEIISYIQNGENPLALYIFGRSKKNQDLLLQQTKAGSTCINNVLLQFNQYNLPFGGVNNSGIGRSHGFYGFKEFSNARAVLRQSTKFSMSKYLFPPFTKFKKKLAWYTIKWL